MLERFIKGKAAPESMTITRCSFPQDLDGQVDAVLSAINSETKSLALLMLGNAWTTPRQIRDAYLDWAEWPDQPQRVERILGFSVMDSGAVEVKKTVNSDGKEEREWRLTEEGQRYVFPAALAALKLSHDQKLSLTEVFGKSQSVSSSGPGNTARILKGLSKSLRRQTDLVSVTGLAAEGIAGHLKRMQEAGLVLYESVGAESNGWARYTWIEGKRLENVPLYQGEESAVLDNIIDIVRVVRERGTADYREVAEILDTRKPHYISDVLRHLERMGFLEASFIGGEKQSDVELTEKGKEFAMFVYDLEDALEDGECLAVFEDTKLTPEMTRECANHYREISSVANSRSSDYWFGKILGFVRQYESEHNRGPRAIEIERGLEHKGIARHLSSMYEQGLLDKERKKRETRYFIASDA